MQQQQPKDDNERFFHVRSIVHRNEAPVPFAWRPPNKLEDKFGGGREGIPFKAFARVHRYASSSHTITLSTWPLAFVNEQNTPSTADKEYRNLQTYWRQQRDMKIMASARCNTCQAAKDVRFPVDVVSTSVRENITLPYPFTTARVFPPNPRDVPSFVIQQPIWRPTFRPPQPQRFHRDSGHWSS
ncbi:hypothetical protein U1Q18_051025 [Sarracenia purpurea var. burkii]